MPALDTEISQRFSVLRFPLIVGVVLIHNHVVEMRFSGGPVGLEHAHAATVFVQDLVSEGPARTAVPLFFLMAGYFFFLGRSSYGSKLKSRCRSLLLPFLLWNLVTLAVFAAVQWLPATQDFVSGRQARIAGFGAFDYVNAIIGITRAPIAYQFWFVRDLIVLVLLAPLVHVMATRAPLPTLLVLFTCWLLGTWPLAFPSAEAVLFFVLGAVAATSGQNMRSLDRHAVPIFFAYAVALLVSVIWMDTAAGGYLMRLGIVFGVPAAWCLTKFVVRHVRLRNALLALSASSFFVFAAHEPVLTVLKKITFKLVQPSSDLAILLLYFLIPLAVIVGLVWAYRLLVALLPGPMNFATGGR